MANCYGFCSDTIENFEQIFSAVFRFCLRGKEIQELKLKEMTQLLQTVQQITEITVLRIVLNNQLTLLMS